jgi:FkbM family methyltransferase
VTFKAAKRFLRRRRLRHHGVDEEVRVPRLALAYSHGAWMVHPNALSKDSTVYSFGVGSNVAWDLAMIERFGVTIHAFDPTPRAIDWVRSQALPPRFVFHDYGVSDHDGTVRFFPPRRNSSFNYSSIECRRATGNSALIEAPVRRVGTIMRELGHQRIDVLKMDIEGGEYGVIDDLVESGLPIGQILVEFHHNFRSVPLSRTVLAVRALRGLGYRVFHVSDRSYELSFIHESLIPAGSEGTSVRETIDRFNTPDAAAKYARSLVGSRTHEREVRCIRRALDGVGAGARVLDLPCGTGRLLPMLLEAGFHVTEADSSAHMIDRARETAEAIRADPERVAYAVADVSRLPFDDGAFDAVVCNRLLHHFREPEARRKALAELSRVSRGPVVASFFCSEGWDGAVFHVRNALASEKATDRIPIPFRAFADDADAAGLVIDATMPTRPGISKQWYVVMRRARQAAAVPVG